MVGIMPYNLEGAPAFVCDDKMEPERPKGGQGRIGFPQIGMRMIGVSIPRNATGVFAVLCVFVAAAALSAVEPARASDGWRKAPAPSIIRYRILKDKVVALSNLSKPCGSHIGVAGPHSSIEGKIVKREFSDNGIKLTGVVVEISVRRPAIYQPRHLRQTRNRRSRSIGPRLDYSWSSDLASTRSKHSRRNAAVRRIRVYRNA